MDPDDQSAVLPLTASTGVIYWYQPKCQPFSSYKKLPLRWRPCCWLLGNNPDLQPSNSKVYDNLITQHCLKGWVWETGMGGGDWNFLSISLILRLKPAVSPQPFSRNFCWLPLYLHLKRPESPPFYKILISILNLCSCNFLFDHYTWETSVIMAHVLDKQSITLLISFK